MKERLIDPKCFDLARHFLQDVAGHTEQDVKDLADSLQCEAEMFCEDLAHPERPNV